jgi:hypothetical protein
MLLLQISHKYYNICVNPLINELQPTGIIPSSWKLGLHITLLFYLFESKN